MSNVTIAAATLEGFRPPPGLTTVEMRVYCSLPFVPTGEADPVQSEPVGASTWYRKFTCTVSGENLSVPEIVLPATLDGSPGTAKYSARFYRPAADNFFVADFTGLTDFSLPASPSSTTWAAIFAANNPAPSLSLPGSGIFVQTAPLSFALRTITGTANRIGVTNGDGVAGNPTLDIGPDVVTLTGSQTLTNKTFTNPRIETTVLVGTPGGTPVAGIVGGPDASGTNIAGANLELSGGKGTGNAAPGLLVARYPLRTASGATLQSLSTDRFPISTSLYTNTTDGTAISNTTTETSVFTGATASAGSTRTIEAGSAAAGAVYRLWMDAGYSTTGTPTLQIRIKLGSTIIGDTTAFNATTGTANGRFFLEGYIFVDVVGAAGSVRVEPFGILIPVAQGTATPAFFVGSAGAVAIDFTANRVIDVTAQWGTASASNTITMIRASIERIR